MKYNDIWSYITIDELYDVVLTKYDVHSGIHTGAALLEILEPHITKNENK